MTERFAERVEQLESRVDRVENQVNGLATSPQVSELHTRWMAWKTGSTFGSAT